MEHKHVAITVNSLADLRRALPGSLRELADALGVTSTAIYAVLCGKTRSQVILDALDMAAGQPSGTTARLVAMGREERLAAARAKFPQVARLAEQAAARQKGGAK